jgi:curli biogenesis system outer membrane secretion channel CsgG
VRIKGIGVGGSKGKAQVNLTARVIDVTSGEIVASVKGEGISNKGGGFNFDKSGFGVGTNAEEWRNSGIGDAQEKATIDFVSKLVLKKDNFE